MGIAIHPSILSADFTNLQRDLEAISTADAAHVDVMDNHFVPNLTLGLPWPRVAVDHGTALDLAGSGRATASSLIAALDTCARLATTRQALRAGTPA